MKTSDREHDRRHSSGSAPAELGELFFSQGSNPQRASSWTDSSRSMKDLPRMSTEHGNAPSGSPPHMTRDNDAFPSAPMAVEETGVDEEILLDLVLRLASTAPQFTTDWAASRLHLTVPVAEELLEVLRKQEMVEILGQVGVLNYRYSTSQRGRERAVRLFEVSGYVGAAPVSLEAYNAMLEWQLTNTFGVRPQDVKDACSELSLAEEVVELAGIATAARRSLFLSGPTGNGKTTLARLLHNASQGDLWIPHCIHIDHSIICVFDPKCHEVVADGNSRPNSIDHRWVRVRRPFVTVGGEMTVDSLDLIYSSSRRYYEAPPHFKANGGTFLIDDFGRQRMLPDQLLNRWIVPLESQIDYLTLQTGQKIQVPFRVMLIIATNLDPEVVMEPAFLRRMGYRLYLDKPSPQRYANIFLRYAAGCGFEVPPPLIDRLIARYHAEHRELLGCHPRDLIERVRDICRYTGQPEELTYELVDMAWRGYFGTGSSKNPNEHVPPHHVATAADLVHSNV